MSDLSKKHCKPCEGGVCPLDADDSMQHLEDLPGWRMADDQKSIARTFNFGNFLETMSFVNALAFIAEREDHHPDFSAGYNYCNVRYTTHAIGGLSENDFICAAKINQLLEQ